MTTIYLVLGSNVGDSDTFLDKAIELLKSKVSDIKTASRYRSKAFGYTDQPDFVNTAIEGATDLSPQELLKFVKDIEKKVGRIKRFRWGPREIDMDIIFYGNQIIDEDNLHIPHAGLAERDFVLRPLLELNSNLVDPKSCKTIEHLLNELPEDKRVIYKIS